MSSSVIHGFGYDKKERRLVVSFVSDKVYSYDDLPAEIVDGFGAAASKGSYTNEVVRHRFPFARPITLGGVLKHQNWLGGLALDRGSSTPLTGRDRTRHARRT